jgi:hypothetical protein
MTSEFPHLVYQCVRSDDKLSRRIKRISSYYSRLGVKLMFERSRKLREHLENSYDEDLVHKVPHEIHHLHNQTSQQAEMVSTPDVRHGVTDTGSPHLQHQSRHTNLPRTVGVSQPWHHHPNQTAKGLTRTGTPRHSKVSNPSEASG